MAMVQPDRVESCRPGPVAPRFAAPRQPSVNRTFCREPLVASAKSCRSPFRGHAAFRLERRPPLRCLAPSTSGICAENSWPAGGCPASGSAPVAGPASVCRRSWTSGVSGKHPAPRAMVGTSRVPLNRKLSKISAAAPMAA